MFKGHSLQYTYSVESKSSLNWRLNNLQFLKILLLVCPTRPILIVLIIFLSEIVFLLYLNITFLFNTECLKRCNHNFRECFIICLIQLHRFCENEMHFGKNIKPNIYIVMTYECSTYTVRKHTLI